jgi:hypothetical protein
MTRSSDPNSAMWENGLASTTPLVFGNVFVPPKATVKRGVMIGRAKYPTTAWARGSR